MPEFICNTSPLPYLHQLGQLPLLPALVGRVIVPPAVSAEIAEGRAPGLDLPDLSALSWLATRSPSSPFVLDLVVDLGPGETQVLSLCLEATDAIAILDDGLARRVARARGIRHIGTLGLLLEAKRAGIVSSVAPWLDRLQALRFRIAPATRAEILKRAREPDPG